MTARKQKISRAVAQALSVTLLLLSAGTGKATDIFRWLFPPKKPQLNDYSCHGYSAPRVRPWCEEAISPVQQESLPTMPKAPDESIRQLPHAPEGIQGAESSESGKSSNRAQAGPRKTGVSLGYGNLRRDK